MIFWIHNGISRKTSFLSNIKLSGDWTNLSLQLIDWWGIWENYLVDLQEFAFQFSDHLVNPLYFHQHTFQQILGLESIKWTGFTYLIFAHSLGRHILIKLPLLVSPITVSILITPIMFSFTIGPTLVPTLPLIGQAGTHQIVSEVPNFFTKTLGLFFSIAQVCHGIRHFMGAPITYFVSNSNYVIILAMFSSFSSFLFLLSLSK